MHLLQNGRTGRQKHMDDVGGPVYSIDTSIECERIGDFVSV